MSEEDLFFSPAVTGSFPRCYKGSNQDRTIDPPRLKSDKRSDTLKRSQRARLKFMRIGTKEASDSQSLLKAVELSKIPLVKNDIESIMIQAMQFEILRSCYTLKAV